MNERERAIHALNRLTFGPRPGDVDRVLAVGVDNWIAEQLNPDKIDDSALEARLAPYRTLRMTAAEMVENFPPPPVLKLVADGKLAMPSDPQLKAVYAAGMARLNDRQAKKNDAAKNEKAAQNADLLEMSPDDMTAEMREQRQEAREHARSRALDLMELPPERRTQSLAAMDADERRGFWRALSPDDRDKLTADMTPRQRELLLSLENPVAVVNGELFQSKLLRATYSERQLQEVMTDFWFNHFNVYIGKGADRYHGYRLRARRDPAARAGQVPRPAAGHGEEPGDAVVSGQLAERRAGFGGCGQGQDQWKAGAGTERELRA